MQKFCVKYLLYRLLPSLNPWLHGKRRKGLERQFGEKKLLVCQTEQDRIFARYFLKGSPAGVFWEIGCGDGTTGSLSFHLEQAGWHGLLWENLEIPRRIARTRRTSPVQGGDPEESRWLGPAPDFLAIRRPAEFPWIWSWLETGNFRPRWVTVENSSASVGWLRRLKASGHRLQWFFHDDEYYYLGRP